MAIPAFTKFGLLPDGCFPVTVEEITQRYLHIPNRKIIWNNFLLVIQEVKSQAWYSNKCKLLIDGGFTSDKQITKDVDVLLVISDLNDADAFAALCWVGKEHYRFKNNFQVDMYPYHAKISSNNFQVFFTYVKLDECLSRGAPVHTRKGILELII